MQNRQRVTITMKRKDGRTIHVRKTTKIEAHQKPIIKALNLSTDIHITKLMLTNYCG
jgi:hypothetical protein